MNPSKSIDWESSEDLIYVVDKNLDIVEANDSWRQFAAENNGKRLLERGKPINALESMSGGHRERWQALYNVLLSGQLPEYRHTFSCPSPTLHRKFELIIQPRCSPSGEVEYLEHRTRLLSTKPGSKRPKAMVPAAETSEAGVGVEKKPIQIRAFSRPLEGDGGDLVWTHYETGTRVWWLIADAMGHDERAARAAERLRDLVAENVGGSPKSVIETVNAKFIQAYQGAVGMFVTGILCLTDLDLHEIRVCTFGHQGFLTTNNGSMKLKGGMPVGILLDAGPWPEDVLDTSTIGERGMVFTDGLIEQFNSQGEMYSIERLLEAFLNTMDVSLPESLKRIFQSVDEFRNGAAVKDDQTLLGFEFLD
jgi:hypothetical protein